MMHKKILGILMTLYPMYANSMNIMEVNPPSLTLHHAISTGRIKAVRKLLRQQGDLEALDVWGQTPLLSAASSYNIEIAHLLLNAGANPNAAAQGRTALHYAAMYGKSRFARSLIHKGAFLNPVCVEDGYTPLHHAVIHNAASTIMLLCDEGADVTIKSNDEKTPLEIALDLNALQSFRTLLIHDSNRSNNLLLSALTNNSSAALLCLLILEGVLISNQTPEIQEKITQLFALSSLTSIMLTSPIRHFRYALNTLTRDREDYFEDIKSALIVAYAQGYLEHATELESRIRETPLSLSKLQKSALRSAVTRGDTALCKMLLEKLSEPEDIGNHSYLLYLAHKLKHHEIANLLLSQINLQRSLSNAVKSCHVAIVDMLLNAGAPTHEAEEFITDPTRTRTSKLHETFFSYLLKHITAHREILRKPTIDLYLSLLPRDVLTYIIGPMVKTH